MIDRFIHKSQHFVEKDSIPITFQVDFVDESFKSCSLMSDSMAIIFSHTWARIV